MEQASRSGSLDGEAARELARRAASGALKPASIRLVLLERPGAAPNEAADAVWQALLAGPKDAPGLLVGAARAADAHVLMRSLQQGPAATAHTVQAAWRCGGAFSHGLSATAAQRKDAQALAALSLIGHLSGRQPVPQGDSDGPGWKPFGHGQQQLPDPSDDAFHETLRLALLRRAPDPMLVAEVASRADDARLHPRDLCAVLFDADDAGAWAAAKSACLAAAGAEPGAAAAVLTFHIQQRGLPSPVRYEESQEPGTTPRFRATARLETAAGHTLAHAGPERSKKRARDAAAARLLARILKMPEPDPPALEPEIAAHSGGAKNPVSVVHELQAREVISALAFSEPIGSGSPPTFHATAACLHAARELRAEGRAPSKQGARESAARALIAAINGDDAPETLTPEPGAIRAPRPGENPVALIHHFAQRAVIADLVIACDPIPETKPQAFAATASCALAGARHSGTGRATSKRQAREAAARHLITLLALAPAAHRPQQPAAASPDPDPMPQPETETEVERVVVPDALRRSGPLGEPDAAAAAAALRGVLLAGAHMTADTTTLENPGLLVYPGPGAHLPEHCPAPLEAGTALLIGPGQGAAVSAADAPVWKVPLRLAANTLAALGPQPSLAASARSWQAAVLLGLEAAAQGMVYPGADARGSDTWRLGPLPDPLRERARRIAASMPPHAHCLPAAASPYRLWAPTLVLRAVLDALADDLVRSPGAHALTGAHAYTARAKPLPPQLLAWADRLEERADPQPPARLVIAIRPPGPQSPPDTDTLWARLRLRIPAHGAEDAEAETDLDDLLAGPAAADPYLLARVRRLLRAAAAAFPPLSGAAAAARPGRIALTPGQAALLAGEQAQQLRAAGIEAVWPGEWAGEVASRTVVADRAGGAPGAVEARFDLAAVLDFRWQLTLDGEYLTDEEMDALAEAGRPLVRLRGRWVLLAPETLRRARHRGLGTLSTAEALRAALTGSALADGALHPCDPGGALRSLLDGLRAGRREPVTAPSGLDATLRGYQAEGLGWLDRVTSLGFGACLADDMGTGKTITAIALVLHRRAHAAPPRPSLVACPASMLSTWEREIARFAPGTPTVRYHGPNRTLDEVTGRSIVITTYATVLRDAAALSRLELDLAVADEAQQIKNAASQTAQAMRTLRARSRIALTGTPIENTVEELRALLDWLNPGMFERRAFHEIARPLAEDGPDERAREAAARLHRLTSPFLLRRRKSDRGVLDELPEKIYTHRYLPLTDEQIGMYEALAREVLAKVRSAEGIARRGLVLSLIQALRQICNCPDHYLRRIPGEGYDAASAARRSAKLAYLNELLPRLRESGEHALVFTSFASMGRILQAHLRDLGTDALFLHGKVPATRRQEMVDAFQQRRHPVMILTAKAGGSGLTLTEAEHVVMVDRPLNPAIEAQCVDRAHRIGQRRTLQVHLLSTENTVEDRINALLERKRRLAHMVLDDDAAYSHALSELTDAELADLISLGARR